MSAADEKKIAEEPRNTDLIDEEDTDDSLTFSNGVIEKIVALSLHDVPNLVGMKGGLIDRVQGTFGMSTVRQGVSIEVRPDGSIMVTIAAIMAYGAYAPQIFEDVKVAVVDAMRRMTGLTVAGVTLRIEDVYTPEDIAEQHPQLPSPNPQSEVIGALPA